MISVVIPTLNRGYALSLVLDSFYRQKLVEELIIVDDGGSDNTAAVVDGFSRKYPLIKTIYLKNEIRRGAPHARQQGLLAAEGKYILFADDDGFLEENYTEVCRKKLEFLGADIVSGRHFYRKPEESVTSAIARFQAGLRNVPPFDFRSFSINSDSRFQGDVELPFTHAIFLAKRELLLSHDIDIFYSKGNGFREESDVQARIYTDGGKIIMTNDTHSVHLHPSEVRSGGQRVGSFAVFFWSLYYTSYFFQKYYNAIMKRQGKTRFYLTGIITYFILAVWLFATRPVYILRERIFKMN